MMKRAATSAERTKASVIRKARDAFAAGEKGAKKPTPDALAWLRQYEATREARAATARPVAARERALHEVSDGTLRQNAERSNIDAPSRTYEAPPPPPPVVENALDDFSKLDPAPVDPDAVAPAATPGAPYVAPAPGAELAVLPPSGQGCGLCPECRSGERAPRCALSGSVVPRPLSDEEAGDITDAIFGGLRGVVFAWHKHRPSPATEDQRARLTRGIVGVSKRHDLQAVANVTPYYAVLAALTSYATEANAEAAAKAEAAKKSA